MPKNNQSSAISSLSNFSLIVFSVILTGIALLLFIALWSYHPADPAWRHNQGEVTHNTFGVIGAWYSDLSFSLIGKMGYLLPVGLIAFVVNLWREKGLDREIFSWRLFMLLTAILSGAVLWAKHDPVVINSVAQTGGGALGAWLTIGLEKSVGSVPIIMAFSTLIFAISLSLLLGFPWVRFADWIGSGVSLLVGRLLGRENGYAAKEGRPSEAVKKNEALQDKINLLNETSTKKQAESPVTRPAFTIDRYEPEVASEPIDAFERPAFIQEEPASVEKFTPVTPKNQPVQTQQSIPVETLHQRQQATEALPIETTPSDREVDKAEPNFFDFGSMKKQTAPSQLTDEMAATPAETTQRDIEKLTPSMWVESFSSLDIPLERGESDVQSGQPAPIDAPTNMASEVLAIPEAKPRHLVSEIEMADTTPASTLEIRAAGSNNIVSEPLNQPLSAPEVFEMNPDALVERPATVTEVAEPAAKSADITAVVATATTAAVAATTQATIGKAYDGLSEQLAVQTVEANRPYELPSVQLLDTPPAQNNAYTEDDLAEMAGVLESTLTQFNIQATVMHVSPGPVITRFELELAPGIQAKKITNLSQDLARALAVSRVRVEEVIPGSSYVGLEVPNKQRQTVFFRDIVCSKPFRESQSPLTISLGSDTSGKPQVADLMKMPHALVAGTTGSGKSVCINTMLLSMLYKASPKDLRLILVDPKMLEMSMYEDIPHLLTPVITDMNEAENALTWAVGEMERRYQLMAALKVRKIDAFNELVDSANAKGESIKDPLWQPDEQVGYTHHPALERLPFIVIVIDELADMMMVVGKQVEQLIARLTQKARAAGIHVVLATQRPSTDVLTGLIKANVPTRIAFQVSSGTDSRVIIDGVGAEKLLGHGDMLFVPPGASHPQRFHGAFVGDAETDRITDYLRSTSAPQYIDGVTGKQDPETLGAFGAADVEAKDDADPLYEEAVQIVLETGKASISSVQRQLRIGYNRAARMIEDMQEQGIVSEPVNGTRKVLGRR